ncbi:hypothetical protein D3C79_1045290 [compost metagenome]
MDPSDEWEVMLRSAGIELLMEAAYSHDNPQSGSGSDSERFPTQGSHSRNDR